MRSFALLLLLLGIIIIVIGVLKIKQKCPPPRIEFRFIPKSLLDEQLDPATLKNLDTMFDNQDPWLGLDVTKHTLNSDGNMVFSNEEGKASNQYDKGSNFYSTKYFS